MGKFAICCPNCGNYVTAYNGLRGMVHNKIKCVHCDYTIDVKNSRMTSIVCASCNNVVMYDQGKKTPKCPVCNHEILPESGQKLIKINCPTCHTIYSMSEGAKEYTCPLCDSVINVQKEVAAIQANSGVVSVIEYEPGDKDWLVYKHPVKNFVNGSQLIVRPGQQALLIEAGEDSHMYEAGQYTMDTVNFPAMERIYNLPNNNSGEIFQSTIYFFNTRTITNDASGNALEWFVKKTPVIFPMMFEGGSRVTNVVYDIGCGGTYDIHIQNARQLFLELNSVTSGLTVAVMTDRTYGDTVGTLSRAIKAKINAWGGEILSGLFQELGVGIFELDIKRSIIAQKIQEKVNGYLSTFGLEITNLLVDSFATPGDDPEDLNYKSFTNLKTMAAEAAVAQQKEIYLQNLEEQHRNTQREQIKTEREALAYDEIEAQRNLIRAKTEAESARMKGFADAEVMSAKGYTQKDVLQAEVQKAYAEGIGNMGSGGVGGSGIMSDMIGMSVGLAAVNAMSAQVGTMLQGLGKHTEEKGMDKRADLYGSIKDLTMKAEHLWDCPECGNKGNISPCCPMCGAKKPDIKEIWDCPECGNKGNISPCCPMCGAKKPDTKEIWDCPECGNKGNISPCCPMCGAKKPDTKEIWDCQVCGNKGNNTAFCPNCGVKKLER